MCDHRSIQQVRIASEKNTQREALLQLSARHAEMTRMQLQSRPRACGVPVGIVPSPSVRARGLRAWSPCRF